MLTTRALHGAGRDVLDALRSLRRSPGFVASSFVTLALGIGATTAILALANVLLLKPLPVREPDRLLNVQRIEPVTREFGLFSVPDALELAKEPRALSGLAVFTGRFYSLRLEGEPAIVSTQVVSANYLDVVGVTPALGRSFRPDEDRRGAPGAAILSDRLWRRDFGADPGVVGRTVHVNGRAFTVCGVLPAAFTGTFAGFPFDLWMPLGPAAELEPAGALESRSVEWLELIGRLAPGASRQTAGAALAVRAAAVVRDLPKEKRWGVEVHRTTPVDDSLRRVVIGLFSLLFALAGLVLAMACVNVAGLLLARGARRRREIAIRQAIGASRAALVRRLLVETLLVFALGGAGGIALAGWLTRALVALGPKHAIPLDFDLSPDPRVLGAALLASLVSGLVFGIAPALRATRVDLVPALKEGSEEPRPLLLRARGVLVVSQIAGSMLLLVSAALLARTVDRMRKVDTGFDMADVQMATLATVHVTQDPAASTALLEELLARSREIPGVTAAALVGRVPLAFGTSTARVSVDSADAPEGGFVVDGTSASPGSFETLGIPLLAGRDFTSSDGPGTAGVVIVNEAFTRRFTDGRGALGRRVAVDGAPATIVGIAKDARLARLGEPPKPLVTRPFAQRPRARMTLLLKTAAGTDVRPALRAAVRTASPDMPVLDAMRLSDFLAVTTVPQRLAGSVAAALGLVGLLLAAVGLYGVVQATVQQRTREIGIRVAVGASRSHVVSLVARQSLVLAGAGVGLGGLLSFGAAKLLARLVDGVGPADALSIGAAAAVLALVTLLSSVGPARRALGVDPLVALRAE